MPKLYELVSDFLLLYDIDPDDPECGIPEEVLIDTLEALEMDLNDKLINIGRLVKSLKADAEALRNEERRLANRRRAIERRIENLTAYAMNALVSTGKSRVDDHTVKLALRNNPESVHVLDLLALKNNPLVPWKPFKYTEDDLNKTELKELLQHGTLIAGVELRRKQSLSIT